MITTYKIGSKTGRSGRSQENITCLMCGMTSYHPGDVSHRYCAHCHMMHDQVMNTIKLSMDPAPGVSGAFAAHLDEMRKAMPEDSRKGLHTLIVKSLEELLPPNFGVWRPKPKTVWQWLLDD